MSTLSTMIPFWVITGGVASGKSSASRGIVRSKEEGAIAFFSADRCVHDLLTDPQLVPILEGEFGSGVISEDGQVDRDFLRARVLSCSEDKARLESILHPRVFAALESDLENARANLEVSVFLAEIPLYFETGARYPADLVITVACPYSLQLERLVETRGLDADQAGALIKVQTPTNEKMRQADIILWNAGDHESLEAQIGKLVSLHLPTPTHHE